MSFRDIFEYLVNRPQDINNEMQDLADALGATILSYKESIVPLGDSANKEMQDQRVDQSTELSIVQTLQNASTIVDRVLKENSYPLLNLSLKGKRTFARLQRGDRFKFSHTKYGISNVVFRVMDIRENNLEDESLELTVIQDIDYLSNVFNFFDSNVVGENGRTTTNKSYFVETLSNIKIIESPYPLFGDEIGVLPIASRENGNEVGYQVFISIDDGTSYSLLDVVGVFAPSGTLVDNYPATTHTIDDIVGFEIDSTDTDIDTIDTVTRKLLFTDNQMALLGNELISIQNINPHATIDNRYKITGIYRGRFDTQIESHSAGETFFFLSTSNSKFLTSSKIVPGAALKFKFVPYSSVLGDISSATEISLTVTGRAKKPLPVSDLIANDIVDSPTYTNDIVLTWNPRVRGQGAGVGIADSITDASPTWEGYFEIEVYVSDILVRTISTINALTWTYTSAMNISDNGSLANSVTFKILNYREEDNYKYESIQKTIIVDKE